MSAAFIGLGRLGIDVAAAFLFAPLGLAAMFLAFFMAVFALSLAARDVLDAAGVTFFSAGMREQLLDVSLLGMGGIVAGLTLVVALIAGAVTAARVPRLWGLIVIAACVFWAAAFLPTVLVDKAGGGTWTFTIIANAYQYILPAIMALSLGLLLIGLVHRRSTELGRAVASWPRFSLPIYVARYGLLQGRYWLALMKHGGWFALTAFALGVLCVGLIFVTAYVAKDILVKTGLLPTVSQFQPLFTIMDMMLWIAVLVLSVGSVTRAQPTRVADFLVAALAALAVYELGSSLSHGIALRRLLESYDLELPFVSRISQTELESLNGVALVWLFRTLLSGAFVKAYVNLRSASARTARELSDTRPEPPILFLRSFADDEQLVPSSDTFLAYAFGAGRPMVRLEEIVADIMFAKGPLVALADPVAKASTIGAARDVETNDGWQKAVLAYLDRSQINICFFGRTSSFLWEIDQILDRGGLSSTLIVFPPSYPNDRQLVHDAPRLAAMIGLRDEQDERARLAGALVLVQDRVSGVCEVVVSKGKRSFDYREAILHGAAVIRRNATARLTLQSS